MHSSHMISIQECLRSIPAASGPPAPGAALRVPDRNLARTCEMGRAGLARCSFEFCIYLVYVRMFDTISTTLVDSTTMHYDGGDREDTLLDDATQCTLSGGAR